MSAPTGNEDKAGPDLRSVEGARRKGHRALDSARLLLESDDAAGAASRSYYALFYLTTAVLSTVGEQPKTHGGTLNRFWERFVKTGRFPRARAETMHTAFAARQKADYNFVSVHDTAATSDLLADVEAFCEAAEALLDDLLEDRTGGE